MPDFQLAQTRLLLKTRLDRRVTLDVHALPTPFWTLSKRPLLQYVRSLVYAAERGDSAEVSWLLSKEPADFSELQSEAFHCALFAGVLCGHHRVAEIILQHQNTGKAALVVPSCTQLNDVRSARPARPYGHRDERIQPEEPVSFLALAYGWERNARHYPLSEEENALRWSTGHALDGPQYLGLMQLLLEYGLQPALAIEGLLQKLVCTLDMAAVAILQAYHPEIGDRALPDGRTLLHLLVSSNFHQRENHQIFGYSHGFIRSCSSNAQRSAANV